MHSELESQVWLSVQQVCDAVTFQALLLRAVDSFKRSPGTTPSSGCTHRTSASQAFRPCEMCSPVGESVLNMALIFLIALN